MSNQEIEEKAITGRKLSWAELAEALEASRQEAGALKDQCDQIINGFAELFPGKGWTTEPHPELGPMPEEFASHVLAKVRRLVESVNDTNNAARLAISIASLRAAHLRDFIAPESLAQAWYEAINTPGNQFIPWSELQAGTRGQLIEIAERVNERLAASEKAEADVVDGLVAHLMAEGDEFAAAIRKLAIIQQAGKAIWDQAILPAIRALHALGIDLLPPGTIVHGATPAPRPHKPE